MPLANEPIDGPYPYDVTINGSGYVLARGIEPSLPFRTQRAKYAYTPTFIERSNVSGSFGDNQQDFWLTVTQNDWSLGEGQKFFDSNDPEKSRKYYFGLNVDPTSTPGQLGWYGTPYEYEDGDSITVVGASDSLLFTSNSTNLKELTTVGYPVVATTDRGAHGAGAAITAFAFDGTELFFSSGAAGTIRKYNTSSHAFASFSATGAECLLYLNNTLYGTKSGVFNTYASTGAATASFTFKDGAGGTLSGYPMKLAGLGGKVLVLRNGPGCPSLWEWDGSGMSKLADYPPSFTALDFCVAQGIVFIAGIESLSAATSRTAVWFYDTSSIGRTFYGQAGTLRTGGVAISPYLGGFVFTDPHVIDSGLVSQNLASYYDITSGAVSTLSTFLPDPGSKTVRMAATDTALMIVPDGTDTSLHIVPVLIGDSPTGLGTNLFTSLFDFGSTLPKYMRGVTLDYESNGVKPNIRYTLDGLATGATTLLTPSGAVSGQEYLFPAGTKAHSIGLEIDSSGLASNNPPATLKRLYIRAAPIESQYRTSEYIFDLSATQGKTPVVLNNGQPHPKTGRAQLDTLLADITALTPFTVVDRLGTFTAVADLANMEVLELRQEQFYVRLPVRQV